MRRLFAIMVVLGFVLTGCGGGDEASTGSSSVGAPASVLGNKLVLTVSDSGVMTGSPNVIQKGETITYSFIDANTILGDGMHTLPSSSWNYTRSGDTGTVSINYGSIGYTVEDYTFTSATGGTYYSKQYLSTGSSAWNSGTFRISSADSTVGGSDTTPPTTGEAIFWTRISDGGSVSINVDGSYAGALGYYLSSAPNCGDSGGLTVTLTPGTHSFSAEDQNGTWSGSMNISAGGCFSMELN